MNTIICALPTLTIFGITFTFTLVMLQCESITAKVAISTGVNSNEIRFGPYVSKILTPANVCVTRKIHFEFVETNNTTRVPSVALYGIILQNRACNDRLLVTDKNTGHCQPPLPSN